MHSDVRDAGAKRVLAGALGALLFSPMVLCQVSSMPADGSLPPGMVADFGSRKAYAFVMDLPETSAAEITARVVFQNDDEGHAVEIEWTATQTSAGRPFYDRQEQLETVSYLPTAVCEARSTSNVMYTAGWIPRYKLCIVERWEFSGALTGITTNSQTGVSDLTLTPPRVSKSVILVSGQIAAIEAMAVHPVSQELLLLENGPDGRVHALGADEGGRALTLFSSAAVIPELAHARDLRITSHQNAKYMLGFLDVPVWSGGWAMNYVFFFDVDEDGEFEAAAPVVMDREGVSAAFPSGGWQDVE